MFQDFGSDAGEAGDMFFNMMSGPMGGGSRGMGMGRGMDDKNKIAELASRGFKILRVKLVTLEEDCGFALVSLWREQTEEDTKSRRCRSKAPAG